MDPTVVAAWIAAGVSVLTLVGTLAAQYLSYRAASRDAEKTAANAEKMAEKTAEEQRKQLDRTLAEQREHQDVLRGVAGAPGAAATALTGLRRRLGPRPLELLFQMVAGALSPGREPWSHACGLLAGGVGRDHPEAPGQRGEQGVGPGHRAGRALPPRPAGGARRVRVPGPDRGGRRAVGHRGAGARRRPDQAPAGRDAAAGRPRLLLLGPVARRRRDGRGPGLARPRRDAPARRTGTARRVLGHPRRRPLPETAPRPPQVQGPR